MCACSQSRPLEYDCSAPEGAILVLPIGASRTNLASRARSRLLAHAREQALNWLEWVYGSLDYADSLYLITGCDKCRNFCLASYSNLPVVQDPLIFTPTSNQGDLVQYDSQTPGIINMRTFLPDDQSSGKQTVFIRGYKIQACRTLRERLLQGSVKITDIMSEKDKNPMYFDAGATQPRSTARKQLFLNRILSKFTDFGRRGSRNQPTDSLDEDIIQFESLPGSAEVKDASSQLSRRSPEVCQVHHPSDIINSYMLRAVRIPLFVYHSSNRTVMQQES